MHKALVAAEELEEEGIETVVLNLATIKPIDEEALAALARECGAVITVEEHQIRGGMGSAVAEVLVRLAPVPMEFVGVDDTFGQTGKPEELLEYYGMSIKHIKESARKLLQRKIN